MFIRLILCSIVLSSTAFGQSLRWDDAVFGMVVVKPEKGRQWVVQKTFADTQGSILQEGDLIIEVNDVGVNVEDDVPALIELSGDTVKIKAKRFPINKRTEKKSSTPIVDEAVFERTMVWDIVSAKFRVAKDEFNDFEIWTHDAAADALKDETSFLPSLVMQNETPTHVRLYFQYRASDWLFIESITFRHGNKEWIIKKSLTNGLHHDVMPSGGIKEWFFEVDGIAAEILQEVGTDTDQKTMIRLHGNGVYKDHEFSNTERVAFADTLLLHKLAIQRPAEARQSSTKESPRSLDELRDAVLASSAEANAMMERENFTADEKEYVAKYVNRGPQSVNGKKPHLLEHKEIQEWNKAERAYIKKRDAKGDK